jgi:TIR domain
MRCPVDETRVPLEDSYTALSRDQEAITRQMDASADAARSIAAASSIILGKEETTDFDVFLCHNGYDKPAVRWTAERLREHGILPWLDEVELAPGRPWQEELERQISHIRAAAVFVTAGPNHRLSHRAPPSPCRALVSLRRCPTSCSRAAATRGAAARAASASAPAWRMCSPIVTASPR